MECGHNYKRIPCFVVTLPATPSTCRAVQEFEQVLRFDNLPPDLRQQAGIYARAAWGYQAGRRLSAFGYA